MKKAAVLPSGLAFGLLLLLVFGATHAQGAPTVAISTPSAASTASGPITYTVTYTAATVVTLDAADITLNPTGTASGTVAVTGTDTGAYTVTISDITGDGTLGITILAGTAADAESALAPAAGPSTPFTVDNTRPTIAIGSPSVASTTTAAVTYTVTYTGATAVTLAKANITLHKTGTAGGTIEVTGTGTDTRTVKVSGVIGVGTLALSIAAGTAADDAGNLAPAAGPSTTFTVNNTTIPALSISAPSANNTTGEPVTYTVNYTGASSVSLAANHITLNKGGTATGTVTVEGTGTVARTVTISNITGTGTLGISIVKATAANAAGLKASAAGPGKTFNVNLSAPAITISSPSATVVNSSSDPVTYTVSYLGASTVTLAAANITLDKTGTADGTVEVSGTSTAARTVTISNITGAGTLGISIAADTAADADGNKSLAAGPGTTFTVDPAPIATISAPSKTTTVAGPVTYTVTYIGASAITLAAADITLNRTGTSDGTISVSGTGTASRTVTIHKITGVGTLGISIAPGTANDGDSHQAAASSASATFKTTNTARPAVAIEGPSPATTAVGPVTYTVRYSGATAVTLADRHITLNRDEDRGADGTFTVSGTGTTQRTVTISNITGNGTLGISIAGGTAINTAHYTAGPAGPSAAVTVRSEPGITISAPSVPVANNGPVTYTVTYARATAVTLTAADIALNRTDDADGQVAVSGSGTGPYTVTISNITGNGTLGFSIAAGTATDALDHEAPAAGPSDTFKVYQGPIASLSAPAAATATTGPITYAVTYEDAAAVTLSEEDITLNRTGTACGTVAVTGQGTAERTVTISNITGKGTLGISIAAGTATDLAGKPALALGPAATFAVTNTDPAIAIYGPSVTDTVNGPVTYTVTYSGVNAITLSKANITLNRAGTATGTVEVTGAGATTRTVTISRITGQGALGISIAPKTASDATKQTAPAVGPSKTFNVDLDEPFVTISAPSAIVATTGPVTYTVNYYRAAAVTLKAADITLNPTDAAAGTIEVSGTGTSTRTVTIKDITGTGTLGITIAAGTAVNADGDPALAPAAGSTFYTNLTEPVIKIGAPSATSTTTGPITYKITCIGASAVTLADTDITLNRTGTSNGFVAVTGEGTNTRTVTISKITGKGTLGITIGAGTAADAQGNKALASDPSTTFTATNSAPALVISEPSVTSTTTEPVTYTLTYSGVTSVVLADRHIIPRWIGTAAGTVTIEGSGTASRTIRVSNITGSGAFSLSIASGTGLSATKVATPAASCKTLVLVNVTDPTAFISGPSTAYTSTGPVTYTIDYLNVTDITLTSADVALNRTGTADGTVFVSGTGTARRTVTISDITGAGTLGISLPGNTAGGNGGQQVPAAGPSATFNVHPAPTIAISAPTVPLTIIGPVTYHVTYTGATDITLATKHIKLNRTGNAIGVLSVINTGPSTRAVKISNITGRGTLGISIAAGTAADSVNKVSAGAAGPSGTFYVNLWAPAIEISAPSVSTTAAGPVTYTVTYIGAKTVTLAAANVTLIKTGDVSGTVEVTGAGTSQRTVTISDITGNGTLGISIGAGTASLGTAGTGNRSGAKGPSATFTVDNTRPTLSIGAPSAAVTTNGPITYTVTYGGAGTITLAASDVTLNKTGDADGTVEVTGTSPTTRTVRIANITGDGTLGITIAAGTAKDPSNNVALAAGPSATFDVDNTPPAIDISEPSTLSTTNGSITYTVTYTGADTVTLDAADIHLDPTGTAAGELAVTGEATGPYTVTISNITGAGSLGITIDAGTAEDAAGNDAPAKTSNTFTVTN